VRVEIRMEKVGSGERPAPVHISLFSARSPEMWPSPLASSRRTAGVLAALALLALTVSGERACVEGRGGERERERGQPDGGQLPVVSMCLCARWSEQEGGAPPPPRLYYGPLRVSECLTKGDADDSRDSPPHRPPGARTPQAGAVRQLGPSRFFGESDAPSASAPGPAPNPVRHPPGPASLAVDDTPGLERRVSHSPPPCPHVFFSS